LTPPSALIWPVAVNRREHRSRELASVGGRGSGGRTGWGTRRAEPLATMDHADMRELATAFHRSVAALPRSRVGDHRGGCPHSALEGSPHRVQVSRSRSGVRSLTSCPFSGAAGSSRAQSPRTGSLPTPAPAPARSRTGPPHTRSAATPARPVCRAPTSAPHALPLPT
jgi:hypothetical protein